jgi:BON domain
MPFTRITPISRVAVLTALVLALGVSGCKSTPKPDDNSLNSAVQQKLTNDTAISSEPIQSSVQDGVVTLQGAVSSEAAKALAASDASQVPGVKNVVNSLTVQTAQAAPAPVPMPVPVPETPVTPIPVRIKPAPVKPTPSHRAANYPPPVSQPAPIERPAPQQDQSYNQPPAQPQQPPPPPPPAFRNVTIPSGTTLPVRITETLDSATTKIGDTFSGVIASDVVIDGLVAIPSGTAVSGQVNAVQEAAHFKGNSLLTISLTSVNRHGEHTAVITDPYSQQGKGRGKNTAEKVGGGAAVGAILGGIFGGGKGAAIGAAAGGGLGAGANGITRGQQVQIPSETVVRFHLSNPVDVRASTAPTSNGDANLQHHNSN